MLINDRGDGVRDAGIDWADRLIKGCKDET